MKAKLGCLAAIAYILVGFVQILAMIKGVQIWLGIPWIMAAILSTIIAYIPLVGMIAGIKGAMVAWGWTLGTSVAFFCWPLALYGLLCIVGAPPNNTEKQGTQRY